MLSVFILVVSTIALVYLLIQLIRAKKQGRFLQTVRDLLIILLAILMTQQFSILVLDFLEYFNNVSNFI